MLYIGAAKTDITAFKENVGLLGYGMYWNISKKVATPLYVRAFVFKSPSGKKLAYVNAELAFITISLQQGVIKRLQNLHPNLGYGENNVFLSAQHTHSGQGGYSHHGLYNITTPGYVPEVYEAIVEGITTAIVKADEKAVPATIKTAKASFDQDAEVAFNRSVKAYNQNPDAEKVSQKDWHKAVDREMHLWRIDGADGKKIGAINWFGVHCTSVSNDNLKINADNKGYASTYFEESQKSEADDFQAIFAQKACGDISPNYKWDKKKKWTRGKFEDDFESAQYNGKLQFDLAKTIFEKAENGEEINGEIDSYTAWVDMSRIFPYPEFTGGNKYARTGPACHGLAFFAGTVEGPGMPKPLVPITSILLSILKQQELIQARFSSKDVQQRIYSKYMVQGKKQVLAESGECRLLNTKNVKGLLLPGWADPTIKIFKQHHRSGGLNHKPWTEQILPLQISIIGNVALAAIPGEITTIAAKRLRETILSVLEKRGVEEVIICSYSNAYCGYITTYEEYQLQCYEGGHTVFGEYTLAAFQSKFKDIAEELLEPPEYRGLHNNLRPLEFTEEELAKRRFPKA